LFLIRQGVLVLVIGLALAGSAVAHTRSQSFSVWHLDGRTVRMTFNVRALDATRLRAIADDRRGPRDLGSVLLAHLLSTIAVRAADEPCRSVAEPRLLRSREGYLRVEWQFGCPTAGPIEITNNAFFDVSPSHIHYARVRAGEGSPLEYLFTDAERRRVIRIGESTRAETGEGGRLALDSATFGAYVGLGAEHILVGLDHMAFLLALLLLCRRLRDVVFMVTGFTLGHSITLSLAALGLVEPNVPVVEALIGFTIALVAVENISVTTGMSRQLATVAGAGLAAMVVVTHLPIVSIVGLALFAVCYLRLSNTQAVAIRFRPTLTVLFGLIHGFGFASVLIEIGLPAGRLSAALFGFNIGVEIGQLALVAIVWATARLVNRQLPHADFGLSLDALSAALCGLGLFWFLSRSLAI
jgi:hypothetical protein